MKNVLFWLIIIQVGFFTQLLDSSLCGTVKERSNLSPVSVLDLGPGWANNTVNTVIFRHHGIVTFDSYQFAAFYDDKSQMVFVRRDLRDDSLSFYRMAGEYNTRDAHNSISLGLDPKGYVHVSYDHHGHPLRYRKSTEPLRIDSWTEPLQMTGNVEDRVTYPYFVMVPSEDGGGCDQLLFMYRDGSSGNGDACLKAYDHESETWSDRALRFLKGTEQKPWPANAYWNHPAFDSLGRMHLSWVWRVNRGGPPGGLINNVNVGYAYTPDSGRTWLTSDDLRISTPMTPVNNETIQAIGPGNNLINQCSSAVDSKDRVHIVAYADDPDGIPQYFHLWFGGREWTMDFVTQRTEDFRLAGGGALQIPFSRPEILIGSDDRVYVLYRGDLTDNCMVAQCLEPPDYRPPGETIYLWDENLMNTEPVIDRIRWDRDKVLSMLIQKNFQPDHDVPTDVPVEPVRIVDWKFGAR